MTIRNAAALEIVPDDRKLTLVQIDRKQTFLHAGQIFVSADPYAVTTILGSCVSVCLWDPETQIGGLNHFLLSLPLGPKAASAKFGEAATRLVLDRLLALGVNPRSLKAKVFGGACITGSRSDTSKALGTKNANMAVECLAALGIPVVSQNVGGCRGRKLIFHTDDGTAFMKLL